MSASPAGPLQTPRDERREMLSRHFVTVVEQLTTAGQSYADLSVAKLIRAAKISRSAFYDYFDDKGDLLAAMAEVVVAEMSIAGNAWWTMSEAGGKEELLEALRPAVEVFRTHYAILKIVAEGSISDPRVRAPYHRLIEETTASLADHIRAGQARGSVAPELDPPRTARWLNLMNERALHYSLGEAVDDDHESGLRALRDIIWRTLYEGFRTPRPKKETRPRNNVP